MEPRVPKIVYPYESKCGIKYQIMPGGPEGRGYVLYEDGSTGTTGPGYTEGPMSLRTSVSTGTGTSANSCPCGPTGPSAKSGSTLSGSTK